VVLEPPTRTTVVIALREPHSVRLAVTALAQLRFPFRVASPDQLVHPVEEPGVIHCVDATQAGAVGDLAGPAVVVSPSAHVDSATEAGPLVGTAFLPARGLTAVSLLQALIVAALGTNADFVARQVAQLHIFSRVPVELIEAFLHDPSGMTRLRDVRRCMKLSRARAHALVRFTQRFDRAEHLLTALRCASWAVLMHRDLARAPVEEYLGIQDRSDFRRACQRAGVPAPREGLVLHAFSL